MTTEQIIIDKALELGFSACAIVPVGDVELYAEQNLREWLDKGYAANMNYMHNNLEKRLNPQMLVEQARSMIIVAINYYPEIKRNPSYPEISYYAYGKDYHDVIKEKLKHLWNFINKDISPITGRIFTDSAPVMERYWAEKAGLGFIGKSNNLIIPGKGSFFFLGEIICDLELCKSSSIKQSVKINCGKCSRCIDSCPTGAISLSNDKYLLDSHKCIAYQTIENKTDIDPALSNQIGKRIYGCDTCLKVCPFNKFAEPTKIEEFKPTEEFLTLDYKRLDELTESEFKFLFKGSPIKRAGFYGIKRNLSFARNNFN